MKKIPALLILLATLLVACAIATVSHFIEPFGSMQLWPLYAMTFFAGFVFATFMLICFLKREFRFVPNLIISIFVFMFLLSNTLEMYLEKYTALALAFEYACIGMIAFGASLSTEKKLWKIPVRLPLSGISLTAAVLSFLCPLITAATEGLKIVMFVLYGILILGILGSSVITTLQKKNAEIQANPVIVCVLISAYVYFRSSYVNTFSPDYVLCVFILLITLIIGVKEVVLLERKNAYLTKNMQVEIERQTNELRTASEENKQIVYSLSHNLKKSVIGLRRFAKIAHDREKDEEQAQLLRIVYDKAHHLEKDLDELSAHAQRNYAVDASEVFLLNEVLDEVHQALSLDCEANGISFKLNVSQCKIFGHKKSFVNAMISLLVNALSHDGCKNITISTKIELARCILIITDDSGWYSEDDKQDWNVCKAVVESMQGQIEYEKRNETSEIRIILPII